MSYDSGSNYKYPKKENTKRELPAENMPGSRSNKWRRYRFQTKAVEDYRPLIFNPKYPWWCSGHGVNSEMECSTSTIIAYLPIGEDLKKYWDDAFDISFSEHDTIEFSGRFPKPKYFIE